MRFASASKFEPQPHRVCRGRRGFDDGRGDEAMVTALEFDAASPGILYVGTETGKVMVGEQHVFSWDTQGACFGRSNHCCSVFGLRNLVGKTPAPTPASLSRYVIRRFSRHQVLRYAHIKSNALRPRPVPSVVSSRFAVSLNVALDRLPLFACFSSHFFNRSTRCLTTGV